MEKFYIRSQDIEQKIHSVKLPYLAWKVLFLLGEKQSVAALAEILGDDEQAIEGALKTLIDEELAVEVEAEAPAEKAEEKAEIIEETPEPAVPEIEEEEQEAEATPEQEEIVSEETPVEIPEAEEKEESDLSEIEEEESFTGIEDFDIPGVEEELVEERESDISEVESDIELPQLEEETEKLDFDFENMEEPAVAEAEKAEEKEEEKEIKPAGAPTLLVIDDSIVIRKMVELALEGEDLILETATSGKEGLKALDEVKPDVVVLDLMLPDINGIDLLKTIKASLNIPVIMLSGKDSPQMIEKAKAEGADAFLPKPFRDEELVKTIHELLQK
ncbi:response regulator [Calditrichota bacterium LG25]